MRPCSLPALRVRVVRPVLLVPQTGLLGGAERVLLDWSRALARPAVLACPPGPLAEAAAAAGLEVVALPARSLRGGPRGAARLAARSRDIARLARRHRPAVVVASGLRPVLAAAAAPLHGARLVTVHHDLAYAGAARVAARRGTAVATSSAVAAARRRRARDPPRGRPAPLGAAGPGARASARAAARRAGAGQARRPGARDRGADARTVARHRRRAAPGRRSRVLGARCARGRSGIGRVRFLGALDDPRPRSRKRTASCTARTARRSGSRWWRRWRPGGRSWRRPPAGRSRSSRPRAAACTGRATPRAPPRHCARCWPTTCSAGARARAADFDGAEAARRFAALIETVAS